jgi:hypothetical protein
VDPDPGGPKTCGSGSATLDTSRASVISFCYFVLAEETTSAKKLRSDATFAEVNPVWFGHRYVPVPYLTNRTAGFKYFLQDWVIFYLR